MKRSIRKTLRTALIFLVIGCVLCFSGLFLGASISSVEEAVNADAAQESSEWGAGTILSRFLSTFSQGTASIEGSFSRFDVDSMKLEIGSADCILIPTDGDEWSVHAVDVPQEIRAELDGKTLEIKCSRIKWKFWEGSSVKGRIEIEIPKDAVIKDLTIDTGVGDLTMEDGFLSAEKLELDAGVGNTTLNLDIQKEAKIDTGVGDLTLNLLGKREDFKFDLDLGVGSFSLGDTEYSGISTSISEEELNRSSGNGAKEISIDSGIGSVSVQFFNSEEEL